MAACSLPVPFGQLHTRLRDDSASQAAAHSSQPATAARQAPTHTCHHKRQCPQQNRYIAGIHAACCSAPAHLYELQLPHMWWLWLAGCTRLPHMCGQEGGGGGNTSRGLHVLLKQPTCLQLQRHTHSRIASPAIHARAPTALPLIPPHSSYRRVQRHTPPPPTSADGGASMSSHRHGSTQAIAVHQKDCGRHWPWMRVPPCVGALRLQIRYAVLLPAPPLMSVLSRLGSPTDVGCPTTCGCLARAHSMLRSGCGCHVQADAQHMRQALAASFDQ
jgi:hypothetical protein